MPKNSPTSIRWAAVILLVSLVALLTFYKHVITNDFYRLETSVALVQKVRGINAELNENILKARFYFLEYYDPLVDHQEATEQAFRELRLLINNQIKSKPAFNTSLTNIEKSFQAKVAQIELFKSKNAIYKNSERYLPILLADIAQKSSDRSLDTPQTSLMSNLGILLLNHLANPSNATSENLIRDLQQLPEEAPQALASSLTQLRRHIYLVVKEGHNLDKLVKKALSNRIDKQLAGFAKILSNELKQQENQARVYDVLMLLICLLLIGIVAQTLLQLRSAKADLEQRVLIRTNELAQAKEISDKAAQTKTRFLATMSHEIRTPMNAVLSCTSLLLDNVTQAENIKLLKTIEKSGDLLLNIINDVLDFSKVESGNLQVEYAPMSVRENVEDIIDVLGPKASAGGAILTCHIEANVPEWIKSDAVRIRQVLTNLIGNAIKFTKNKVEVRVTAKKIGAEKFNLRFAVTDNGIGIPKEGIANLFRDFSQIDASTTRKYGGTGLGLAICKGITEALQGTIDVNSIVGRGATFEFVIPTVVTTPKPKEKPLELRELNSDFAKKHPLNILMAEDNATNQLIGEKLFARLGYQIEIAGNGKAALQAVQQNSFDIVFMDQHMPEMDGVEATEKIRSLDMNQPKIYALTASVFAEDKQRCLQAGMDGFLSKPFNLQHILTALKSCKPNHAAQGHGQPAKPIPLENPNTSSAENHELIDIQALLRKFRGMEDILSDVANHSIRDIDKYMQHLQTAIEDNNPTEVKVAAHTLKGIFLNFKAQSAVELALKLEGMGKNDDLTKATLAHEELANLIIQLKPVLRELGKKKQVA